MTAEDQAPLDDFRPETAPGVAADAATGQASHARRTMMLFGDSNTHGTTPIRVQGVMGRHAHADRWPEQLKALLPGWEIITEGHPGRTTVHDDPIEGPHRNGITVLPSLLESHRPLDLVVIMLGTNDLKPRFSVTATDIALSVERLVRLIQASRCGPEGRAPQILVAAPPPVLERGVLAAIFEGAETRSRAMGPAIAAMCARLGLPFLDAGQLVQVSEVDGIHYEAEASPALAQGFAAAIRQHFG